MCVVFQKANRYSTVFSTLFPSNADILIGYLNRDILSHKDFIASNAYYHDALTWCVQAKKPIPIWQNLFRLCNDPIVWILYTVMSFITVFVFYYLQQLEDVQRKWDWFRLTSSGICSTFGFPSEFWPRSTPSRVFYMFAVFGQMIFTIYFGGVMLTFIMEPIYEKQINSIQEIVDQSFDLTGDEFAWQHLMRQTEV